MLGFADGNGGVMGEDGGVFGVAAGEAFQVDVEALEERGGVGGVFGDGVAHPDGVFLDLEGIAAQAADLVEEHDVDDANGDDANGNENLKGGAYGTECASDFGGGGFGRGRGQ